MEVQCQSVCYIRAEKDAGSWSKSKLKSLLVGLKFTGAEGRPHSHDTSSAHTHSLSLSQGECEVTEASKVSGEATAQ